MNLPLSSLCLCQRTLEAPEDGDCCRFSKLYAYGKARNKLATSKLPMQLQMFLMSPAIDTIAPKAIYRIRSSPIEFIPCRRRPLNHQQH